MHVADDADLLDRLEALTGQEREFRTRYDAAHPEDVDALDAADHAEVHEVWLDLDEWQQVRREIRLVERARKERGATKAPANG